MRIYHPYFPKYFSSCFVEGKEYLAMEFVKGKLLGDWLTEDQPTIERRIQLFTEFCKALAYMHEHIEVYHRDLKSNNVMVTPAHHPKIIDLGLAKTTLPEQQTTTLEWKANIINTPPETLEQILGDEKDIIDFTEAQEVWAAGCVGYFIFSGKHPFSIESQLAVAIKRIIEATPEQLNVPGHDKLGHIIHLMLKKKFEQRPLLRSIIAELDAIRVCLEHT